MQVKQVFINLDASQDDDSGRFRLCPYCGAALESRPVGGESRQACPDCGFVQFRNPAPGVVVVVEKDAQVLLGRRRGGYGAGKWGLPQGYIEFEEDFLSAAIREVKEETGLEVSIHAILNVASNLLSPRLHTLAIILLADVIGGELQPGDDVDALEWVPLAGPLPEMAFASDERIILMRRAAGPDVGLPVDPDYAGGGAG